MMKVKIFQAHGPDDIVKMQKAVNTWIEEGDSAMTVLSITPAMCSIGPAEDRYQHMTLTVLYRSLS